MAAVKTKIGNIGTSFRSLKTVRNKSTTEVVPKPKIDMNCLIKKIQPKPKSNQDYQAIIEQLQS